MATGFGPGQSKPSIPRAVVIGSRTGTGSSLANQSLPWVFCHSNGGGHLLILWDWEPSAAISDFLLPPGEGPQRGARQMLGLVLLGNHFVTWGDVHDNFLGLR